MNLLEAQLRHHAADVLLIEVLAESRVAADAFQDLSTVTELDEIHVGGLVRHLVVAQNLLLGIVGYHEETVVLAHQLDVGTVQPERPVTLLVLFLLRHLLAQSHSLGIDMGVVDGLLYRTLYALHDPR